MDFEGSSDFAEEDVSIALTCTLSASAYVPASGENIVAFQWQAMETPWPKLNRNEHGLGVCMKDKSYQVLIVDDDPQIPRLIKAWLSHDFRSDFGVNCVTDPLEALGLLHQDPIDLLITDIDMPALNGYHLLREAKQINALVQVMFLTGHLSPNAFRSARQMGADEYLLKPVSRKALNSCVRYMLRRIDRWQNDLGITFSPCQELADTVEY